MKKLIPNPPNSIGNAFYLFNNLHHISTCCTVGEQRHNALYLCIKIGGTSCLNYKNARSVTLMLKTSKSVRCGMYRQKSLQHKRIENCRGNVKPYLLFWFFYQRQFTKGKNKTANAQKCKCSQFLQIVGVLYGEGVYSPTYWIARVTPWRVTFTFLWGPRLFCRFTCRVFLRTRFCAIAIFCRFHIEHLLQLV